MAEKKIFREAALERLSTPDRLDQGLKIVGSAEWIGLGALVALIVIGAIWALGLRVPITVAGSGILLEPGGLFEVTSGSRGRLINFAVAPGDQVKAGQEIAKLDQSELQAQLETAKAELRDVQAERDQIAAFQARKKPTLAAATQQKRQSYLDHIKFLSDRLEQLVVRDTANRDLMAKGYIAVQKLLDTQLEIGQAEEQRQRDANGLKDLDFDETKQRVTDEQEMMQTELKVASAQRKYDNLVEQMVRESSVTSPYAGRVVELRVKLGEIVERGASLFTVIHYILSRLTDEDVDWMATAGKPQRHEAGDILISQGEPVDTLMFVLDGKVSVELEGVGQIASLGSGEMLGEMSLVDEAPPSATVVVTEPTHVLHIDHSALNAKLDIDPYFAARLYRAIAVFLSMRMRSTVQQLGYGKAAAFGEDEIDMSFLDSVTLAGSRFDRLVKKLLTA